MDARGAAVLIVDDGQDVCQLLCDDLSQEGYQCSVALNGHEALDQLKAESFDVVLLDMGLPDISGMEILKRIASSSCSYTIVTIVISGIDSLATAVEATKRGAADYIVKPFTLDRVRTSIQRALKDASRSSVTPGPKTPDALNSASDSGLPEVEGFKELDAIAGGVQAKYDLLLGHSTIVTEETVEIAHRLGLRERAIQRWVKARSKLDSEKKAAIGCSLAKLERSLAAQELLGLMRPYVSRPENDENGN